MKGKLIVIFIIANFLKLYSQTETSSIIVDSGAKYLNNIKYNTGEVYVIFNIEDETIVSKTIENDSILKLEELVDAVFVFPNPVIDILKISTLKDIEISKIFLFSLDGKNILEKEITNNQLDISFLPSGIYIMKTNLSNTETFKIIKR